MTLPFEKNTSVQSIIDQVDCQLLNPTTQIVNQYSVLNPEEHALYLQPQKEKLRKPSFSSETELKFEKTVSGTTRENA